MRQEQVRVGAVNEAPVVGEQSGDVPRAVLEVDLRRRDEALHGCDRADHIVRDRG